ncbi:MAG TPA: undecaprenyl-diphosphate phosphatase [Gammaproteobacteria bacterium]|nr:undecaprenyl-diphosphate phosphatase [Gammaproteobacteria bacterium]
MHDLLGAIVLGIVEGITEFLPISSTGHLLIVEHWLGARSDLFNVGIQAGAILAITLVYRQRIWQLLTNWGERANRVYLYKLILAFLITVVIGFVAVEAGFQLPTTVTPVAWALIIGGLWMLFAEWAAERIERRRKAAGRVAVLEDGEVRYATAGYSSTHVTWKVAILVGVAQMIAGLFPGTSRSAATIFTAMLFGTSNRSAATEFAFLVGIPTMYAATAYEAYATLKDGNAAHASWGALGVGFVVSLIVAFAAVKWLLGYIRNHRFTPFAIYRIALGIALLLIIPMGH